MTSFHSKFWFLFFAFSLICVFCAYIGLHDMQRRSPARQLARELLAGEWRCSMLRAANEDEYQSSNFSCRRADSMRWSCNI